MGEWGRTVEGGGEGAELVDVYGTLCFMCLSGFVEVRKVGMVSVNKSING